MKKGSAMKKVEEKNVVRSTYLPLLALLIGLLSLMIFLFSNYLKNLQIPALKSDRNFDVLYEAKSEALPQLFSWLYNDQMLKRNESIDRSLLNILNESRLNLLTALSQDPIKNSPFDWHDPQRPLLVLAQQTKRLSQSLDDGEFTPKYTNKTNNLLKKCSAMIEVLRAWQKPLLTLPKDTSYSVLDLPQSYQALMRLATVQSKTLPSHTQSVIQRYTFAWYRQWTEESITQIERQSLPNSYLKNDQGLLLEKLKALGALYDRVEGLSQDLSSIIHFRIQRLSREYWTALWQQNIAIFDQAESNVKSAALEELHRFYKLPNVALYITHGSESEPSPIDLPPVIIEEWRGRLNKINDFTFAKALEKKGYTYNASIKSLASLWFIPQLTPTRVEKIYLELRGLGFRETLIQLFKRPKLTVSELKTITKELEIFKKVSIGQKTWTPRIKDIENLLRVSWRSFRGAVHCNEAQYNLGDSWKDLGIIDRFSPSIHLISSQDSAVLSRRVGRVQWGLSNHHTLHISIFDEDQVTDSDLLFTKPIPMILDLLLGRKIKAHGCIYQVELLGASNLVEWLMSTNTSEVKP